MHHACNYHIYRLLDFYRLIGDGLHFFILEKILSNKENRGYK
jgi:hypothetical protein